MMEVEIEHIRIGRRLRRLREETIPALMESIKREGLRTPISVTLKERPFGESPRIVFDLVAGLRRLTACRRLGWQKIKVDVLPTSDETRVRIWEIDENLERQELTELEVAEHLAERKRLYEQQRPQTKAGVAGGLASGAVRPPATQPKIGEQRAPVHVVGFTVDLQDKIGLSDGQVRRIIRRAEKIPKRLRDRIHELPEIADNGRELDALAKLPEDEQAKAVQMVATGRAANVRQARGVIARKRPSKPPPPAAITKADYAFRIVCGIFDKAQPVERERILRALIAKADPEMRDRALRPDGVT